MSFYEHVQLVIVFCIDGYTLLFIQVLGKVPTISIDKTDGCQMYLSKDSIATEIISAKSSEMNVLIPNGEDFVST